MPFVKGQARPNGSGRGESQFGNILHPKKRAFLIAFANCGHVGKSAELAGVSRTMPSLWCGGEGKMERDEEFAAAYEYARTLAAQTLEDEVIRRGRDGWLKPLYANGKRVLDPVLNEDGTVKQEPLLNPDGSPQLDEDGKPMFREFWKPASIIEFSDTLLIFATKGAMPGKYRETMAHRIVDSAGNDRSLLAEFDRLVAVAIAETQP